MCCRFYPIDSRILHCWGIIRLLGFETVFHEVTMCLYGHNCSDIHWLFTKSRSRQAQLLRISNVTLISLRRKINVSQRGCNSLDILKMATLINKPVLNITDTGIASTCPVELYIDVLIFINVMLIFEICLRGSQRHTNTSDYLDQTRITATKWHNLRKPLSRTISFISAVVQYWWCWIYRNTWPRFTT